MLNKLVSCLFQGGRVLNQTSPSSRSYHFLLTYWKTKEIFFTKVLLFFPAKLSSSDPLVLEACICLNVGNGHQKQSRAADGNSSLVLYYEFKLLWKCLHTALQEAAAQVLSKHLTSGAVFKTRCSGSHITCERQLNLFSYPFSSLF